jgi:hypothetical protein
MAIPHDNDIKRELLLLLNQVPDGTLPVSKIYDQLANNFPELTDNDQHQPYRNSKNLWANRVQFARLHLVQRGYIFDAKEGRGFGLWTITQSGQQYISLFESQKGFVRGQIATLLQSKEQDPKILQDFHPSTIEDSRERVISNIVRRRGQPEFRRIMLDSYGGKCAISGDNAEQALEAVHIRPYKGELTNHPTNGLLLRADLHTLFDLLLLTFDTSDISVVISPELNNTTYAKFYGKRITLPDNPTMQPSIEALELHRHECGF